MIKSILLLVMSVSSVSLAQSRTDRPCPSNEVLVKELLEFEISGVRIANPKLNCIDKKVHANVGAEAPLVTESAEKPTPLVVSEAKPYTIRSIRADKSGQVDVAIAWNVGDGEKRKVVLDKMTMTRYDGPNRKYFGCAVMSARPKEAAVRPSCLNR